jgi:hypothetical protein
MKSSSSSVLILSLAFACFGTSSNLAAQDSPVASPDDMRQCVEWLKASVSSRGFTPEDFCSGDFDGRLGGWGALYKCGKPAQQTAGTAPKYCASSGEISAGETWAAGFRSATRDGSDLLADNPSAAKDSQQLAVTFYSRTGVVMGNLRLAPGMYKLIPSKAPDGWTLAVAKQDGDLNEAKAAQPYVGSIPMKGASSGTNVGYNLAISNRHWATGCPGPEADHDTRELHFQYSDTDLFVCLRPDQVPQSQEANLSER